VPTKLFRSCLFISSFFPLYILLILDNYNYFNTLDKIKLLLKFTNYNASMFFLVTLFLILISIATLISILYQKQNERHTFNKIVKTEDDLLSYIVTYLLPLLSVNIVQLNSLIMNLALFALLGFIYVKNNLIYLNPLFLFFGYNIFLTDNGDIIISNYDIYELKNKEDQRIRCRVLGYKLFLAKKDRVEGKIK